MQDDASKEGNDANATIIRPPAKEQTKLSPGGTDGRRPKQRLQWGEVRSEQRTRCRPEETDHAFAGLRNQLHADHRSVLEWVQRWKSS
jgi:hypothetical protein